MSSDVFRWLNSHPNLNLQSGNALESAIRHSVGHSVVHVFIVNVLFYVFIMI